MRFENGQVEVEHVPGGKQNADVLTKTHGRIMFKEMRDLIGIQDVSKDFSSLRLIERMLV